MVHKGGGHQHPERICTKILLKMGLVSENKGNSHSCQLIVTIPTVSCAKVLLSESTTIGLQNKKNVLIGVPNKVGRVDLFLCCICLILVARGH